jgi:tungstate transport system substrate-binding protein
MKRKAILLATVALVTITSVIATACAPGGVGALQPQERFKVATTTSLYDTGLWGYLEPMFEKKFNVEMDILYAGTGIALEYGKRGDVDAITIHDKAREEQFVAEGYGTERVPFAYNYFLIVGPPDDPAGIKGMPPKDAFKKLMQEGLKNPEQIKFVSRGDESGTHAKEKAIWKAAGFVYGEVKESQWAKVGHGYGYIVGGTGMGPTLRNASQLHAYTLSDIGTFLAYKADLDLVSLVEKGSILLNVYSVIAINPEKHPKTKVEMANNLVDFLTSLEIQEFIGNYGVKDYGRPLFYPCAGAEPTE